MNQKLLLVIKKNRIILDFDLKKTDNLVLTGDLSEKNLNMNKVKYIIK